MYTIVNREFLLSSMVAHNITLSLNSMNEIVVSLVISARIVASHTRGDNLLCVHANEFRDVNSLNRLSVN